MISRHHSERDQSANSGRASTWSIRATSSSDTEILSTMGTLAVSASLERAMASKYPERACPRITPTKNNQAKGVRWTKDRVLGD
jgi:hypothetical protein